MSRTTALAMALLLTLPGVSWAQSSGERVAQQDRAIARLTVTRDSIARLWRAARDLAVLQDSLAHVASVGALDTIDVGGIRLITNRSPLRLREAATRYWPVLDSLYGDDGAILTQYPLAIQATNPDTARRPAGAWAVTMPWNSSVDLLVSLLRGTLRIERVDSNLMALINGPVQPPVFGFEREASDAFIALIASSYSAGRKCYAGDMRNCRAALRLDLSDESMLQLAYATAGERREAIMRLEGYFREQRNLDSYMSCRAGSEAACTEALQQVPASRLPQPLEREARLLLVHLALRLGGRSGYHNLMVSPEAPLSARLASAAGMPIDSLLVRWRATVIAARPAPVTVPLSGVLMGMVWLTFFGVCGLRSSRWRLG